MRSNRKRIAAGRMLGLLAASLFVVPALPAQQVDSLDLDRIFSRFEFFGERFGPARWLEDGTYTTLERSEEVQEAREIVRYDPATDEREIMVAASLLVPEGQERALSISNYRWSEDGTKLLIFTNTTRVWRFNTMGDYWVLDLASGNLRQIGMDRPESSLMYAKFSPDGSRVGYVSENNLYVEDLESGDVVQLTDDGSVTILNGRFDWVYEEEFFLGSRFGADGWRWSPDGRKIAYWQLDAEGIGVFLMINNTDSLYSYTIPVQYPKAGTTNSAARLGIVPADGGETTWLQIEADPRDTYIARMMWADNSDEVMIQHLNRLQNTNRVMLGSARDGSVRTILTETDEAWTDAIDDVYWLDGGERFTWMSERDGWRRMYVVSRDGADIRPVTPPRADVMSVQLLDDEGGWLYYIASPGEPTRRFLYRVSLDGSMRAERVSPEDMPGWHGYQIAPNGQWAFHTYSTFETPAVISLVTLPDHGVQKTLVDNAELRAKVEAVKHVPTEFFRVDVGDGLILDGWVMKPNDFDPSKRYPVLFYVYGEPWGTTVADRWGGTQLMWHQYLTQLGYLVMSIDNRGTPVPRGREWRKIVYRQIGVISSEDQANAVKAVADSFPYVDANRIGIWGWSGGGSSTLQAMFRYPDIYSTGIAVASVPDQRYYDTIYQERYMGLPSDNAADYEKASPITYADGLEGNLLIVHGTGDDNVHFQGAEALINKLIESNKHFTMMAYPNRSHGIYEGRGTRRHLYGLMTRYLQENLPAGGKPGT
jgi:dipeptidyl-peptidase-4